MSIANTRVEKENGIYAEVIAHSVSPKGKEIVTVAVKYGLIVHAEFLRHRMLSRGVKSNRAIPTKTIRKEVLNDPYIPVFLGKNKAGMKSDEEISLKLLGRAIYLGARYPVVFAHWMLEKLGAHKEWSNRLLNPWQWVRETITATEWQNLYTLRLHEAAQRDIQEVVDCVKRAIDLSRETGNVEVLQPGEWHTPYVMQGRDEKGNLQYVDNDSSILTAEQAIVASAARCARSSYDKHDGNATHWKNDEKLYNTLVADNPKHMSPCEHVATPIQPSVFFHGSNQGCILNELSYPSSWEQGITHVDRNGKFWSGNFCGWLQHRHFVNGESVKG